MLNDGENRLDGPAESWNACASKTLVDIVTGCAREAANDCVQRLCTFDRPGAGGLAYRFSLLALRRLDEAVLQCMFEDSRSVSIPAALQHVRAAIERTVRATAEAWMENPTMFSSLTADIPTMQPASPGDERGMTGICLPSMQALLEQRFPSATRAAFEQVRSAVFRVMTPEDVPRVILSYRKAFLTEQTLSLLSPRRLKPNDIAYRLHRFRERFRKGIFIWPLTEKGLRSGLAYDERYAVPLQGRMLEDRDGRLLAWMTYFQEPHESSNKLYREKVNAFLANGVTGSPLQYGISSEAREDIRSNAGMANLIEDIRSHSPLAAARLLMFAAQEMKRENDMLRYILAYRLCDLIITPRLPLQALSIFNELQSENDRSYGLLRRCGFMHVAVDHNPSGKVREVRIGGRITTLNPMWEVMAGKADNVLESTGEQWKSIQNRHGDFSEDVLPR